ncbi:MAG TPA: AarF/ABC1/UbiB kinase family protein [Methanoregulaceae archaeon]|nr:AarF/ABC1/UbiB kinase family protein [Methanoregulaceae archaeon]HPD75281.1 AarF/ABC1/UbiB kinase family protein [Methanoregulaceae archaeon]HRY74795.1 AarF/ABC1/UbiB kinase family protein [Methanoregulaceae archaeon]
MVSSIRRTAQIIDILSKYGFGIALEGMFPGKQRFRLPTPGRSSEASTVYERIRMAVEELGPTFVKFGQIMSTRMEILPPELIEELKKLQDHARPLPFAEVKEVILATCPNLDEWFLEIDETPLASASIGQVHRAVLKDGTKVAVKVQRPGIPELIETDLSILLSMAERIDSVFPEVRTYNPVGMVQDFANQIRKELDFTRDARNADRMARNFAGVPGIRFPKIYWEYTSSRVLVMEFVEGVRIDNADAIRSMGLDPHCIGVNGFEAYLKMIFEDGFYHGDPHPGNLLVTKEGEVVFLDFGIVGVLRPEKRQNFINLLFALVSDDIEMMLKSLEGFGIVIKEADREGLRDDLYIMMHDFGGGSEVHQVNFGLLVNELTETMRRYRLQVPMNLMLLLKVFVMVLDIGVRLDPKFNFGREITPYLTKLAETNTLSAAYVKRATNSMMEAVDAAFDLPRNINLMLKRLSTGTVRLEIVDTDLQKLQMALDRASDKVMMGLVVAALVVGSSLVLQHSSLSLPQEVGWLAVFGYAAAVFVGFYAIYHVIFLKFRLER